MFFEWTTLLDKYFKMNLVQYHHKKKGWWYLVINKVELAPVKDKNKKKNKIAKLRDIRMIIGNIDISFMVINLMAILISRASVMDGLTPFGLAFLATQLSRKRTDISVAIVSSVGLLSIHGIVGYQYIIPIWTLFFSYRALSKKLKFTPFKISIFASILLISLRTVFVIFGDYFLYDIVMIGFEGIIVFALTNILSQSISNLENSYNRLLTSEEIISGAIMLSLAVAGIGGISILDVSIRNIVGVLLVLIFAYCKGPSMGTAVGVTIGLISAMSSAELPLVISIYSISGLLSGLFKDVGKIGSCIGFIIGNGIMSFYINGFAETLIGFDEIIIAALLFILFSKPIKKISNKIIIGTTKGTVIEDLYSNRIKDITYKRLNEFSLVFDELGSVFRRVSDNNSFVEQQDISKFVECIVEDVCENCSLKRICWENDFYTTYNSMFDLMSVIEFKGNADLESLPDNLKRRCLKPKDLIESSNNVFNIFKLNYKWEKKIADSRQLVSQQLEGLSKVIKELASEINKDVRFKEDVERAIYSELRKNNIDIKEVTVTESHNQKFEIILEVRMNSNYEKYLEKIEHLISNVVGFQLTRDRFFCNTPTDKKRVRFKLIKANRFGAITRVSKSEDSFNYVSGDSYTFGERQNNYYSVLSDGMGIGQKANQESSIAISLLEKFLEAGYDKELALKTINSILILKSEEERFATIDMSIIDLYGGKSQFIKIGAAPTFIKRNNKVDIVNSQSLPIGILKDVDFNIYEEHLDDGDFIIMMSDGILDANQESEDKEGWMKSIIENIDSLNPQKIADEIIEQSLKISEEKDRDDMTVLVTKVWKRR